MLRVQTSLRGLQTLTLCLDIKLWEKRKEGKGKGKKGGGVRRESAPCLFRREWKGKWRKMSVVPPNLSTLKESVFLTKFIHIFFQIPPLPFCYPKKKSFILSNSSPSFLSISLYTNSAVERSPHERHK